MPEDATITSVETLNDESFLGRTTDEYTLVDFWAPWCTPCHRLTPAFEAAAERYGDRIRFAKCNVDVATETAALLQVQTIPTVVLFDPEGNEVGRVVNPPPAAFAQMVADVVRERGL